MEEPDKPFEKRCHRTVRVESESPQKKLSLLGKTWSPPKDFPDSKTK